MPRKPLIPLEVHTFAQHTETLISKEVLPMPAQIIQQNYARLLKWLILLVLALIISGCNGTSPKPPEFGTGLVFPGAQNIISLGGFWFNSEGNGVSSADRIAQERDPIGGFLFLYWIDDNGNVCHGQPGVSGQPGPVVVKAFQQEAYDFYVQKANITTTQLVDLQKIPYRVDSYVLKTQASGYHFVQYGNVMWRNRSDGSVTNLRDIIYFSVPLIISVGTTHTLFPYHPDRNNICNSGGAFPLPSLLPLELGQDPSMCMTRAIPSANTMSYQDSLGYCLTKLPQGMNMTAWP
jgi:hypothetical protein